MRCFKFFLLLIFILTFTNSQAQEHTPYKFGKITAADFNVPIQQFDSGVNAVIIADIGFVDFVGNHEGTFSTVFTHYTRVKILNKKGYDIANQNLYLYHNSED